MQAVTQRDSEARTPRRRAPRSIIVPLDGTEAARAVLPLAYLLAGTFEAPIHRIHVAGRRERVGDHARRVHDEALALLYGLAAAREGGTGSPSTADEVAVIVDGPDDDATDAGVAVIAAASTEVADDDDTEPDVEVVLPGDDPAARLADYLRTRPDAIVCLATHARGGLHRRMVGNVADELARTSPCPVVAIGPHADRAAIGRPPATLLLAVGPGLPEHTTDLVAAWARAFDAEVVAAHVDPAPRAGQRDERAHDEVVALSNRLQGRGIEARARIVAGPRIADALLTVAATLPQPLLLVAPVRPRDDSRVPTDVTHQLLHAGRWPVVACAGRP
ncbi:MAG: universal stress protein [Nitriliruptoraceae bacterium]